MSKYIDLDKAITVFDVRGRKHTTTVFQILDKNGAIYETADVVERANANEAEFWKDQYICASEDQEQKHGKWLDATTLDNEFICWVCSECRHGADFVYEPYNYCPNCGARMVEE